MTEFPYTDQSNNCGKILEPLGKTSIVLAVPDVLLHLRMDLAAGVPWQKALLEAVGRWTTVEEVLDGREYRYLIQGEAFDWLLLAERLCV
ncbi:MAG: hypothetical protein VYA78_09260, partial [Chloroflexota bacterium]|nr:hypothetical protein [Chloroflexota bacterium]